MPYLYILKRENKLNDRFSQLSNFAGTAVLKCTAVYVHAYVRVHASVCECICLYSEVTCISVQVFIYASAYMYVQVLECSTN